MASSWALLCRSPTLPYIQKSFGPATLTRLNPYFSNNSRYHIYSGLALLRRLCIGLSGPKAVFDTYKPKVMCKEKKKTKRHLLLEEYMQYYNRDRLKQRCSYKTMRCAPGYSRQVQGLEKRMLRSRTHLYQHTPATKESNATRSAGKQSLKKTDQFGGSSRAWSECI